MHREITSENVIFFERLDDNSRTPREYDLQRPYIEGFKNSRSANNFFSEGLPEPDHDQKFVFFKKHLLYRHPPYIFHKRIGNSYEHKDECGENENAPSHYHRFQHDYYSLGLLLLEIGIWEVLEKMEIVEEGEGNESRANKVEKMVLSEMWLNEISKRLNSVFEDRDCFETWEAISSRK
jgi:hypothetical protein